MVGLGNSSGVAIAKPAALLLVRLCSVAVSVCFIFPQNFLAWLSVLGVV